MRPESTFVMLALCFGLLFLLFTPPAQAPDETEHFFRAYQVSTGVWIPIRDNNLVGGPLPKDLAVISKMVPRGIKGRQQHPADVLKMIQATRSIAQSEPTMFIRFPNMALNFPLLYLPQALGITIGKAFNVSPVALNYLARLTNLLIWIVVVFFAIKTIPISKWLMLMVALTPMSLFLATSTSADTLTYGLCFFFIATVMNLAFGQASLSKQSLIWLLTLCVLVALSKMVYIVLVLLILLISASKFKTYKRYLAYTLSCFGLAIAAALLWSGVVLDLYLPANPDELPDPRAQVNFVLSEPLRYLSIFFSTVADRFGIIARQLIGVLGWLDTPLPQWLYLLSYVAIGFVSLFDQTPDIRLRFWPKFVILVVVIVGVFLVFTGLYVKWTSVGSTAITGVQGRMFTPLFFLFWLLFYRLSVSEERTSHQYLSLSVIIYCAIALSYVSWLLLNRYYILLVSLTG